VRDINMKIDIVKVGELECNCYILDINENVLVIDPGDDFDKIKNVIGNRNVSGIIITHYHFDHIGALLDVKEYYNTLVYDIKNMDEGEYKIGDFCFEVIYTPGHKEDCITIYFKEDKIMFTGDFIFKDTLGRWDLPGGDIDLMYESIDKIRKYDKGSQDRRECGG
jgi:glyoxylase-like metal-dependent hydrolase (beta-lactamase superfamily II)